MRIARGISVSNTSKPISTAPVYDADAAAYFNANTAIISTADKNAINTFYLGLKSDGIYTKMKAMYLPIWGSSATCKWNLKDPRDLDVAYRLNFTNGWTYSSSGITGNGTSSFANTFLNPNVMAQNSIHGSIYSRTDANALYCDFGSNNGNAFELLTRYLNISLIYANTTTNAQVSSSTSRAFYQINRVINTLQKLFRNGTSILNSSINSVTPSNLPISIGAENANGTNFSYSARQYSFASFGDGLTDTESSNLYTRVNTLMTYFGINV